jgi:Fe-S-cluster-containing dehydrogenase component
MAIDRRRFLKALGATTSAGLIGSAARAEDRPELDCDNQWSVLVDTVLCIGCRKCEWACSNHNQASSRPPSTYEDKSVFQTQRRPSHDAFTVVNRHTLPEKDGASFTMKVQCMHCNQPACVSACIVGALKKDPRGPVVYDAWKCIGCRYCMIACPFQVPAYEYHDAQSPEVRKCTFCIDRLQNGEAPACVEICPNEALVFGRRQDLIEAARLRIRRHPDRYVDHIYGEHEAGGTAWLYLAPTSFANTELPRLGSQPAPATTEWIQHGIFKSWVPPLALYALLGLIMHATKPKDTVAHLEDSANDAF